MSSSDDEMELVPQSVTNYHFVDANEEPISFAVLPVRFKGDCERKPKQCVFLHGTVDGGLQKVYKQVIAWKLGLKNVKQPEVMVLTKDKKWIRLLNPRKSYIDIARTILVTIQALHFLRRKPQSSAKNLWDHVCGAFRAFGNRRLSSDDFKDHCQLVRLAMARDVALARSQLLRGLFKERKMCSSGDYDQKKDMRTDDGHKSEENLDIYDTVCAICDNGGRLICCEGRCLRTFHATKEDGEDSNCISLGFKVHIKDFQRFVCKNCEYKQHQCFACGMLGSSDKGVGVEVFPCANATCGHFYHPKCLADLLFQKNNIEAAEYEETIALGQPFTCPVHRCHACKQGENMQVKELQFAVCRRCPKVYHRKCLPRKISLKGIKEEGIVQRAWEDLLPNRILIYCLKHEINPDLRTPKRNHLIFPETPERKRNRLISDFKESSLYKTKGSVQLDCQKSLKTKEDPKITVEREKKHEIEQATDNPERKNNKRVSDSKAHVTHKYEESVPLDSKESLKRTEDPEIPNGIAKSHEIEEGLETPIRNHNTLTEIHIRKKNRRVSDFKEPASNKCEGSVPLDSMKSPARKADDDIPVEIEKITALIEEESSPLTLESILPSISNINQNITLDTRKDSSEVIKAGLKMLDDGGTVDDAKAVCPPDALGQLIRWNKKFKPYLATFLSGMRYTSFGRHFSEADKLQEIVNKLQCYVQSGDTIVDFCCGTNDFSRLMKKDLEAAGKNCSYKNYDVVQPKDDFCFERRDWMKIEPKELSTGSKLIIGLNPPFGANATLANKYIDKALTLKPKLLILIVPKETQRLDQKQTPYDLIWEDSELLSKKPFCLSGSGDANGIQTEEQSFNPPSVYLWSRPDWAKNHKGIALKRGHASEMNRTPPAQEEGTDKKMISVQCKRRIPQENNYSKRIKNMIANVTDSDPMMQQSNPGGLQGDDSRPRTPESYSSFAPGPWRPSQHKDSCGWLDD